MAILAFDPAHVEAALSVLQLTTQATSAFRHSIPVVKAAHGALFTQCWDQVSDPQRALLSGQPVYHQFQSAGCVYTLQLGVGEVGLRVRAGLQIDWRGLREAGCRK